MRRPPVAGPIVYAVAAFAAIAAGGCGEKVQPTYEIEIVGSSGQDPFAEATRVVFEMGDRRQEITVSPGEPFSVAATGVTPDSEAMVTAKISAFAADDRLVAFGETPWFPLERVTIRGIRILVQGPASMATLATELRPRRDLFAASATESANGRQAVLFGTGTVTDEDGAEQATDSLGVWNPLGVDFDDAGPTLLPPRRHAASLTLGDGRVLFFGGENPTSSGPPLPGAHAAVYRLVGGGFASFGRNLDSLSLTMTEGIARAEARMAEAAGSPWAFGGRAGDVALATALKLDLAQAGSSVFMPLPTSMATTRVGHTATTVADGAEVLVVGGASPEMGGAPAERFVPGDDPPFVEVTDAGPNRRYHLARALADGRVLVAGGFDDADQPMADARIYDPTSQTFTAVPGFLATGRAGACAQIVDGDLVIAGGVGPGGGAVADAEIFDAATLAPVAVVPAVARSFAACAPLPNHAAVFIGGVGADGLPTAAVEIYQPRR